MSQFIEIVGRRTSLFTRVPLLFAEALRIPYLLTSIADMTDVDPATYAGNPALKLPIMRQGQDVVFGAQNICRVIAGRAAAERPLHVVWPEDLADVLSRNAQELVWHGMTAQVQLVMGTIFGELPGENVYFVKARAGLQASLAWLDEHIDAALARLPAGRDISLFEVTLFCLVEHLTFRPTVATNPYRNLRAFAATYAALPAAMATAYRQP
jgi:glutathione S-transferase